VLHDRAYVERVIGQLKSVVDQVSRARQAGLTLEETHEAVDVDDWKTEFTGDDARLGGAFEKFFLKMAIERAFTTLEAREG
jgi:hypothetical protein